MTNNIKFEDGLENEFKCGEIFRHSKKNSSGHSERGFSFLCLHCSERFYDLAEYAVHIDEFTNAIKCTDNTLAADIEMIDSDTLGDTVGELLTKYEPELFDIDCLQITKEEESLASASNDAKDDVEWREEPFTEVQYISRKETKKNPKNSRSWSCKICKSVKMFNRKYKLQEHLLKVHPEEAEIYECKICGEMIKKCRKISHKLSHQKLTDRKDCKDCEKKINRPMKPVIVTRKLAANMRSGQYVKRIRYQDARKNAVYQCTKCGEFIKGNNQYKYHLQVKHYKNKHHKCDICDRAFVFASGLRTHLRIHNENRSAGIICDICGKTFLDASYIEVHMRLHTGERPFQCDICSKRCYSQGHLKRHILETHSTLPKRYQCSYCQKPFHYRNRLNIHLRTHTGEKPYTCKICDKPFRTKNNLNQHKKVHN